MALLTPIIDDEGVTRNYHRIAGFIVHYDLPDGQVQLNVLSYITQEERELEKLNPWIQRAKLIQQPLLEFVDQNFTRENLYLRLKTEDPRFNEAEDC